MFCKFYTYFYIVLISVLLTACQTKESKGTPPNNPTNQLPIPLPNTSLNERTFIGATQITGTFQGISIPVMEIDGTASLTQTNDGSLTGELRYRVSEVGKEKSDTFFVDTISGQNNSGNISVPLSIQDDCGETIEFTLMGTINPRNTLNFAPINVTSNCNGSINLNIPTWKLIEQTGSLEQSSLNLAFDPTFAIIVTEERPASELKVKD